MSKSPRETALAACRILLRPIVRVLLKCGVTWKDFAEASKGVFVRAATDDFGVHRRPANMSRVAILTGLNRREVKKQRDLELSETEPELSTMSNATRVLSGWHQDPEFVDQNQVPLELPMNGEHQSFEALLKRYCGDIPPVAMLKELKKVGAIEGPWRGKLKVLKRYYMPSDLDSTTILRIGEIIRDLGDNALYNVSREPGKPSRFEGRASNSRLPRKAAAEFRQLIDQHGQEFLEFVDDWLTKHEFSDEGKDTTTANTRLGVGIYLIEDPDDQVKKS